MSTESPKQNACGGSFATAPGCSGDPKNKTLLQKIICQGQANPTDSITFALLTAATVPAVVLQTAKWIRCGKPSKGALYAFGALGLWGGEVARSLNNIHVDEKNLGDSDTLSSSSNDDLGALPPPPLTQKLKKFFKDTASNCDITVVFLPLSIVGATKISFPRKDEFERKIITIDNPSTTSSELQKAKDNQEIYNILQPIMKNNGIDSTFSDSDLILTVDEINICGGDSSSSDSSSSDSSSSDSSSSDGYDGDNTRYDY